ncbi:hypothetical protein KCP74_25340 [Salmonella enterica subsp. enterica]|nr:hypothetical protein KCP74_25340 [Salmonella enterica subsp. enterica]
MSTDSQYVRQELQWIRQLEETRLENCWKETRKMSISLETSRCCVRSASDPMVWVKGHAGHPENER